MTSFGSHIKINRKHEQHIKICRFKKTIITQDTEIKIWFDSSGSMATTEAPLNDMRNTLLKDTLLPFYNNDETLYNEKVTVQNFGHEETFRVLQNEPAVLEDGIIHLLFQDEASSGMSMTNVNNFIDKLDNVFPAGKYKAVVFQVEGDTNFRDWLQGLENNELAAYRNRIAFKYNVTDGATPQYYADLIEAQVL